MAAAVTGDDDPRPGIEWGGPDVASRQARLDAAYAEYEQRHRGSERPAPRARDPLAEAARRGNAHMALLWLLEHPPENEGP